MAHITLMRTLSVQVLRSIMPILWVGDSGFYVRCPYTTVKGQNCGDILGQYTPAGYIGFDVTVNEADIIENVGFTSVPWSGNTVSAARGKDSIKMTFDAGKPGSTDVTLTYYVNYLVEVRAGICPVCYNYRTQNYHDMSWHLYTDIFTCECRLCFELQCKWR